MYMIIIPYNFAKKQSDRKISQPLFWGDWNSNCASNDQINMLFKWKYFKRMIDYENTVDITPDRWSSTPIYGNSMGWLFDI